MPWHVWAHLPDGRTAVADYRDPIVRPMRRIKDRCARPGDEQAVSDWLDQHTGESAACAANGCGHD